MEAVRSAFSELSQGRLHKVEQCEDSLSLCLLGLWDDSVGGMRFFEGSEPHWREDIRKQIKLKQESLAVNNNGRRHFWGHALVHSLDVFA